jgi:hypothetical protein
MDIQGTAADEISGWNKLILGSDLLRCNTRVSILDGNFRGIGRTLIQIKLSMARRPPAQAQAE